MASAWIFHLIYERSNMNKLVKYEIDKDIYLCPISLNISVSKAHPSKGGTDVKVEEVALNGVLNMVGKDVSSKYVLDFSAVSELSRTEENRPNRFEKLNNAVSYFRKGKMDRDKYDVITVGNNLECLKGGNLDKVFSDLIDEWNKKDDPIEYIHSLAQIRFFIKDMEENNHKYEEKHLKYLESSNVYVNCYINIKAIFLRPDYLRLFVNDMTELLRLNFEDYDKVCLIGVSNNGIILAHLIAYQLHLDVKSINHVGPKYSLDSDTEVLNDLRHRKFVMVSDVICLGGEYRMTKAILEALGAKLLGAIAVVKIRDVYRNNNKCNDKIYSLINNVDQYDDLEYKIYIDLKGDK
jgi:orotate phosphoribosyltransferase